MNVIVESKGKPTILDPSMYHIKTELEKNLDIMLLWMSFLVSTILALLAAYWAPGFTGANLGLLFVCYVFR